MAVSVHTSFVVVRLFFQKNFTKIPFSTMAHYKGSERFATNQLWILIFNLRLCSNLERIQSLEKERQQTMKTFENFQQQLKSSSKMTGISEKFAKNSSSREDKLQQETVGLVALEKFREKRQLIEAEALKQKQMYVNQFFCHLY